MMEFFQTVRTILGIVLAVAIGVNFFYQAFQALRKLRGIQYSEDTYHTFKCQACEDTYEMTGTDFKGRTSIWSTKKEIKTPRSQSISIKFECPLCLNKTFQERIFETDVTAGLGNVRAQFDDHSKEALVGLLIKGILPVIIGMNIISYLL